MVFWNLEWFSGIIIRLININHKFQCIFNVPKSEIFFSENIVGRFCVYISPALLSVVGTNGSCNVLFWLYIIGSVPIVGSTGSHAMPVDSSS